MKALCIIIGFIAYVAAAGVFRGWVLSILWSWFVVPFGIPSIGIAWAIGISGVVGMLTANYQPSREGEDGASKMLAPFVLAFVALVVGWVVHLAMVAG